MDELTVIPFREGLVRSRKFAELLVKAVDRFDSTTPAGLFLAERISQIKEAKRPFDITELVVAMGLTKGNVNLFNYLGYPVYCGIEGFLQRGGEKWFAENDKLVRETVQEICGLHNDILSQVVWRNVA